MHYAFCGLNAVTQNTTINKNIIMAVTAHYCLYLIVLHLFTLLYFSKISQMLCILQLLYLMTLLFNSKSSSHLYKAAAYTV